MSALETPKDRDEAIEMIARIAVEYPHRVREIVEAAEKLGLRLVLTSALAPFIEMAKACEHLHDNEPIAARAIAGNRMVSIDARAFQDLARGVMDGGNG